MIRFLLGIPARLKLWGAAILAGLVAVAGAVRLIRKRERDKINAERAEADAKAHERMNDADLGIGATDAERVDRLREFAAKHGDRPPKRTGG
ncbi:MAG: hypothetical protein ACRC6I_01910 [Paracoccaceae bacterium]